MAFFVLKSVPLLGLGIYLDIFGFFSLLHAGNMLFACFR